jgi:hypothetical protein
VLIALDTLLNMLLMVCPRMVTSTSDDHRNQGYKQDILPVGIAMI